MKSSEKIPPPSPEEPLFQDLSTLIERSRRQVAIVTNSAVVMLYWQIGRRINTEILQNKRAVYGQQIVPAVAARLERHYGRSFQEKNLRRMMQFAEQFEDEEIVVTVSRQLTWSHILDILPLKKQEAKGYYARLVAEQGLSVRGLREQIRRKAFERAEIANLQVVQQPSLPLDTFRDPYILEVGKGFAFVERQKRMIIDGEDFYLDLLFFHRRLRRLVAIELKLGKFQAADKGQMELYLKWLDRYERQEAEERPVGLILCAESSREQVELLELHQDGIVVAEYWTDLPPKKELEKRLHQALRNAQEYLERRKLMG